MKQNNGQLHLVLPFTGALKVPLLCLEQLDVRRRGPGQSVDVSPFR